MDISNANCPDCGKPMTPAVCLCKHCNIRLEGSFEVSPLARLSSEDQALVIAFIRSFGSIKSLQESLGVSYPTARSRLEALVGQLDKAMAPPNSASHAHRRKIADGILSGLAPLKDLGQQLQRDLAPLRGMGKQIREQVRKQVGGPPEEQTQKARKADEILRRLEAGEIDVRQALEEL